MTGEIGPPPDVWSWLSGPDHRDVQLCLALFAAFAATGIVALARARRRTRPSAAALAGLGAVGLAALALRVLLSPRTFLHEYSHVDLMVETSLFSGSALRFYGAAVPALDRLVNALFGGDERALFDVTTAFATLTVPAFALLDRTLFRDGRRALAAALVACLLPLHLRYSASEAFAVGELFFAVTGLAGFVAYVRARDGWALAAGTLGLVLAGETRPEGLLLPFVALAFVLATEPAREWKLLLRPPMLVAFAALAANVLLRADDIAGVAGGAGISAGSIVAAAGLVARGRFVALVDPDWMPMGLPLLAAVAIVGALFGRERRATLWLAGSTAVYLVALLSVFDTPPPANLRTQFVTLAFFVPLCAGGVALVVARLGGGRRPVAVAGACLVMLLAVGVGTRRDRLESVGDSQEEWAFLRDEVPRLPVGGGTLLTLGPGDLSGEIDDFPRFLLRRSAPHWRLVDLDVLARDGEFPAPGPDVVVYLGMYCYSFPPDVAPPATGLHPRCERIRRRYRLEPLATARLPGPGYSLENYLPAPWEVGFYRLAGWKDGAPASTR